VLYNERVEAMKLDDRRSGANPRPLIFNLKTGNGKKSIRYEIPGQREVQDTDFKEFTQTPDQVDPLSMLQKFDNKLGRQRRHRR